jgi:hypothetical protein
MKTVDQLFGWIIVGLGIVNCAFTFRAHGLNSLTVYAGGVLIVVAGLVNVSRANASSGLLRFTAAFATIFVLALALASSFSMRAVLRQNPQAPILVVVAVIEVIFAIWG